MKLFVGLGNPGDNYIGTPHNAGFVFVDKLRDYIGWGGVYSVSDWEYDKYLEADISIAKSSNEIKYVFAKPMTYMNNSGRAVKHVAERYKIRPGEDMVLIHDDLDIKLGSYKIQPGKSPKLHYGVYSVENTLGEISFLRVRLGVDNRPADYRIPGEEYVLKKMSKDEAIVFEEEIVDAIKKLREMIGL